jgi:hypothetical protein
VLHVSEVDLGGSLPAWMVKKFGVATVVQQVVTMAAEAAN